MSTDTLAFEIPPRRGGWGRLADDGRTEFRAYCRSTRFEGRGAQRVLVQCGFSTVNGADLARHMRQAHDVPPCTPAARIKPEPWGAPKQAAWKPKPWDVGTDVEFTAAGQTRTGMVWSVGKPAKTRWVIPHELQGDEIAVLVRTDGSVAQTWTRAGAREHEHRRRQLVAAEDYVETKVRQPGPGNMWTRITHVPTCPTLAETPPDGIAERHRDDLTIAEVRSRAVDPTYRRAWCDVCLGDPQSAAATPGSAACA